MVKLKRVALIKHQYTLFGIHLGSIFSSNLVKIYRKDKVNMPGQFMLIHLIEILPKKLLLKKFIFVQM